MDSTAARWPLAALVAAVGTALVGWFLVTDFLLLSAFAVAWFAATAAVVTQWETLPVTDAGSRWSAALGGVVTYVTLALLQALETPDRGFAVALTVFGLAVFAAAAGTAMAR
ncbi:hypothetical protein [Halorientalis litorea]|jgi:hypothetical protein|uniref:hypothetical protein n=1 Tax=Halorientalis litorea TaxID=2931977 RepID=UPI001FF5C586|nr:hypothetical protein [Halorientalis litorea]